jgi:long-subunit acyl-CoA synthetase (AMP-forming)
MAVATKPVRYKFKEGDTVGKIITEVSGPNIRDNKLALRYKKMGIWNPVSWKKFYSDVRNSALGGHSSHLDNDTPRGNQLHNWPF